jgi:hypothetical protein
MVKCKCGEFEFGPSDDNDCYFESHDGKRRHFMRYCDVDFTNEELTDLEACMKVLEEAYDEDESPHHSYLDRIQDESKRLILAARDLYNLRNSPYVDDPGRVE